MSRAPSGPPRGCRGRTSEKRLGFGLSGVCADDDCRSAILIAAVLLIDETSGDDPLLEIADNVRVGEHVRDEGSPSSVMCSLMLFMKALIT
jgi:hypothetical protein